jgi:hypothetical protein
MNKLNLLFLSEVSSFDLIDKLNVEFNVFMNIKYLRNEDF